jgi:hypothetical protein
MTDGEDADFHRCHLEDDAIVADPKFPVTLECLPQWGSKLFWRLRQAGLDGICNTASDVARN